MEKVIEKVACAVTAFNVAVGIQSSSFKYGVFTHIVPRLEVVLGNGDVRTCDEMGPNRELFHMLAVSYGTLGIVTLVVVELRPALAYVRSEYVLFNDVKQFADELMRRTRAQQRDFLEGLCLAPTEFVIISSSFVAAPAATDVVFDPLPENNDTGELYYYQFVRRQIKKKAHADVIPTYSFLFRSQALPSLLSCPLVSVSCSVSVLFWSASLTGNLHRCELMVVERVCMGTCFLQPTLVVHSAAFGGRSRRTCRT
jgi:hypothetical protein